MSTQKGSRALESPAAVLLQQVYRAYQHQDWVALRALYHDQALLCTQAAHGRIVGPDEVIDIFDELPKTVYTVGQPTNIILDDNAVLVSARLRYPTASGGMADGQRSWLMTFRDGLVYRSNYYHSEAEARTAYAEHGISLGIVSPTD